MAFYPIAAAAPLLLVGLDAIEKFEFNNQQHSHDSFAFENFYQNHAEQNDVDSFFSDENALIFMKEKANPQHEKKKRDIEKKEKR